MDRIDNCISKTLDDLHIFQEFCNRRIIVYWPKIVGKSIAKHSYIISVKPPLIIVGVYYSTLMQQLNMQKKKLLKIINEFIGDNRFTDIKFISGKKIIEKESNSNEIVYATEYLKLQDVTLTKKDIDEIDQSLIKVKNNKLKAILRQLRIRQKQKNILLFSEGYHFCLTCQNLVKKHEKKCIFCEIKEQKDHIIKIKNILRNYPDLSYDELTNIYSCSFDEYIKAKREIIYLLIDKIYNGSQNKMDLYSVTMLITRKKFSDLSEEFVINLTNKYRNKK